MMLHRERVSIDVDIGIELGFGLDKNKFRDERTIDKKNYIYFFAKQQKKNWTEEKQASEHK